MRNSTNKTELFKFLADKIARTTTTNPVIVTKEADAMANQQVLLSDVTPCTHEEADTRIFVHVKSAVLQGNHSVIIKANDTDVVVIAIHAMKLLNSFGANGEKSRQRVRAPLSTSVDKYVTSETLLIHSKTKGARLSKKPVLTCSYNTTSHASLVLKSLKVYALGRAIEHRILANRNKNGGCKILLS